MSIQKNKKKTRATTLRIAIAALAAVLLFTSAFLFIKNWEKDYGRFEESVKELDSDLIYNEKEYELRGNLESILVLGLDKFTNEDSGYNNDKQADFLMLLVIDHSAGVCTPIHINRDSMVNMDILGVAGEKIGTVKKQIALSHTYGNGREVSCRNVANAVEGLLLGMEIDHYVSVTMEAVPVFNDFIGGVTLEILDDFTSVDKSMVKGEKIKLSGEQALKYVRSRQGLDDPTNDSRMYRQRQYLKALYEKAYKLADTDEGFIQRAALKMADYIVSDCSANKLESLLEKLTSYELAEIINIQGETVEGEEFMEFYPDEDFVEKTVVECFYKVKN
ncbi:MAG: LCP family protein [Clostridia bacterium]|nr:LCP family protein [Clostridia bacterium]